MVRYCTREDVQTALDMRSTARDDDQIDRLIEASSRSVEGLCHRLFYPVLDTRYFDWPDDQMGRSWRLWLNQNELIRADTLLSGGQAITGFLLEPIDYGPPFDRLELNISSTQGFSVGNTYQRTIAITGLFGYTDVQAPAGALAGNVLVGDKSITVTDGSKLGVWSVLSVGTERLEVTGRSWLSTAQTMLSDLTALASSVLFTVADGSKYSAGEVLLVDAEQVLITDIAGNNLIVKRQWNGSVLAAHSGATVYAARKLTVARGALGTTPAGHTAADPVTCWQVPGPVRTLAIAETLNSFEQENSAYARTIGSGDHVRPASGGGIDNLRDQTYRSHGRKARSRAV